MTAGRSLLVAALPMALGACTLMNAPTGTISQADAVARHDWRSVVTAGDRQRLRDWYDAWQQALREARDGGHAASVTAEGPLLEPLAALPDPWLPAGDYRCRVIKLGSQINGPTFVAYPTFQCRLTDHGATLGFAKLTGSQRPSGVIYRDSDHRSILLGTLALGDETGFVEYGTDAQRNVAGIVERIGPQRWRIVLPHPAFESIVDVIELVPAN